MTLSLQSISKRFGATVALDDVSFEVRPGEVHALLGENGAGKTTLMRIARGLLRPDAGTVESAGGSDRIGMAHQHFTSIAAFTVAENIALVAGWRESGAALQRRAAAVIEKLGMPLNAAARVRDLTVQLRQRLEIIQALAAGAEVLLLDEPTAVLAPRETAELLAQIRQFAASGGAVVLITHKLAEALQVADRVTVLRRGKVVLTELAESLDAATLSRAMIGDQTTPTDTPRAGRSSGGPGQKLLLWQDLELHTGELIGVAAIEGNGQRALLRGIVDVASSRLDGRVAFIPEDRLGEALLADRSLSANWVLGNLDRVSEWLDWTAIDLETGALIARHDVRTTGTAATPAELSGGNQQKFVLGRALDRQPVLIVAEDPTRGLDIRATAEVHAALGAARDAGACVVVHSSDLDEVLALADRLLVMADGVIRELPVDAPRDTIGDAMLGIAVPG